MKPANDRRHGFFQKFTLCHILTKAYLPDNAESQTHCRPFFPTGAISVADSHISLNLHLSL
ncbi:hypothetical protein NEICINOT_04756 [Neisseria cinerea ATCC 14685]|uniref:Uncharacterized protein n=1 Tax=Neisseria cinerea ATCC 14685 TaxID=546262 RepID=D0W507_NEICI|nr:hypothetical protein NEICINOT_04756 [Neisseria cinerea ATCC 14685]